MVNQNYIAIIGDLVASREMPAVERSELQSRLMSFFEAIDPEQDTGVASGPLITLGDEFQALFLANGTGVRSVLAMISSVIESVRPQTVRFGLGIGPLVTDLQPRALGMDGPCFHRARKALEMSKTSLPPTKS